MEKKLDLALNKVRNLMEAMTRNVLEGHHNTSLKMHGWKRIPSIRAMKLTLAPINELLREVGLKRRLPNKFEFRTIPSDAMNRYIRHQLIRAEKHREEPRIF